MVAVILIPLFLTHSVHAQQTFYKWKDANGTMHYTDTPPPKVRSTTFVTRSTGDTSVQQAVQTHEAAAKTDPKQDEQALQQADAQYRSAGCKAAREDVKLAQGDRMLVAGKDAESAKALTAEERAKAASDAQARITELCDDGTKP
jgi:hypothetical protein